MKNFSLAGPRPFVLSVNFTIWKQCSRKSIKIISITWSNRKGGLSYHRKLQDPATGENFHLISISRGYDFPNCPPYAVAGVVYHECLHIVNPPIVKNGRRIVHGKDFKTAERRYREYEKWTKWHAEVLPKNVRAMNRPVRRWLFGLGKK